MILWNLSRKDLLWPIFTSVLLLGNVAYLTLQRNPRHAAGTLSQQLDAHYFIEIESLRNVWEDPTNMTGFERLTKGIPSDKLFTCPDRIGRQYLCQHYTPDWADQTDIKQLLEHRTEKIRRKCKKYYHYMFNASLSQYGAIENQNIFINRKNVLTNSRLNLACCWIPKMASTYIQYSWASLSKAKVDPKVVQSGIKQGERERPLLYEFWKQELQKDTEDRFTSFSMSRSPWQRLVSVYREKCEQENQVYQCKLDFGGRCLPGLVKVVFEVFIQCVINMMVLETTEHYGHIETSYSRCAICDFPYTYIILMENLEKETEYIFKESGILEPLKVMRSIRSRTIRHIEIANKNISYTDYWKKVPPHLIDQIRFLYRYELALYDYPETPFIV